jgi:AcrR family transcriptional regulator
VRRTVIANRPARTDPPVALAPTAGPPRVRRRPRQARSRERVERVLDAAATLVDALGPDAVTTAMIATEAGVSVGWLYDFFPNREAVFDAVVERSISKVTPIVEQVHRDREGDDWRDVLAAAAWALFDFYRSDPGFRVLWMSQFQSERMVTANREHDLADAQSASERLAGNGLRLVGVDPVMAMHLVIGIIDKGLDLAFRIDPLGEPSAVAETIAACTAYLERYHRP